VIRISEIFGPTVQGEGPLIGKPTVFVRTGGCDYRCVWCDTLYAVLPEYSSKWAPMTSVEILDRVKELTGGAPILVTLSGGNPAMHDLEPLIEAGHRDGFAFSMETQGSLPRDWFGELDWLFLNPKPPSSGEDIDWSKFEACIAAGEGATMAIKWTIFDEQDYQFAKSVASNFPQFPIYLQVGNPTYAEEKADFPDLKGELMARYRWLVELAAQDRWFDPTILPQLHVLAWGEDRGH
jgi:7-carboxy-7-deazaguanine synthase